MVSHVLQLGSAKQRLGKAWEFKCGVMALSMKGSGVITKLMDVDD